MKTLVVVLAGIVLCIVLAGCNDNVPNKIGVVDVVRAVNESNQGKTANAELDALVKAKQAELKEKADAVEKLKKSFENAPVVAKKVNDAELAKADEEYRKLAAASDAEVKKRADELRGNALKNLEKVIETIGREDKFQLIVTKPGVAYLQESIDITDRVVKKYNESTESK